VDWGNVKAWSEAGLKKAHAEAIAPDAWIEEYAAGLTLPEDSTQDRKFSCLENQRVDCYFPMPRT